MKMSVHEMETPVLQDPSEALARQKAARRMARIVASPGQEAIKNFDPAKESLNSEPACYYDENY